MEQTLGILNIFTIGFLAKLLLLVLSGFYLVLTIIIYRQISLMTQTLNSSISPLIRTAALIQIIAVAILFLLVLVLA